jgi:translocation and assembly module TamB
VKLIRWFSWFVIVILFLLFMLAAALRIPAVQNMITQRAISFLKEKIKTEVRLESIYISFPKQIVLRKLYVEDQAHDTLFYAGKLSVDTDLWALTQKTIELNKTKIEDCSARISRPESDSAYNFSYIIQAFADTTKTSKSDTAASWNFNIEDVELIKTSLLFEDSLSGNDVRAHVGSLNLSLDKFDPGHMVFSINSIELKNAGARIVQNPDTTIHEGADTINLMPAISLTSIDFENVFFKYANLQTGQSVQSDIDQFQLQANNISLDQKLIDIEHLALISSNLTYQQDKSAIQKKQISEKENVKTEFNIPWNIRINDLRLSNNSLRYDNNNFDSLTRTIDLNHLHISTLNLKANKIAVNGSKGEATLDTFSFLEEKGFNVESMAMHVSLTENDLVLDGLNFQSANSKLEIESRANFASLSSINRSTFNLKIKPSRVSLKDLLYFSPILPDSIPIVLDPNTTVAIEGELNGSLDDLTIHHLNLKTLDNTTVVIAGHITDLTKPAQGKAAIELKTFRTTRRDIEAIVVDSLLESIRLPEWIEIAGIYRGKLNAPMVNAQLTSSSGNIDVNGNFNFSSNPTYDAVIKTENLRLGDLLKQPNMEALTLTTAIKGSGLTIDTINASIDLSVEAFEYNQYNYKAFNLSGTIHKYLFSGKASLHDENLDFTLAGDFNYNKESPVYEFTLDLTNANFENLNLSQRPLRARGKIDVKLETKDFKGINGNMAIRKVAIFNGESLYTVDSLLFASIDQEGESSLSIESDIVSGKFEGTFNLFKVGGVMKQYINRYFTLHDSKLNDFETPQQFKFNLVLKNTDLVSNILVPQLEFIPGKIAGEFDSEKNKLNVEIGFAQISYPTATVDSLSMLIDSDSEALRYKLRAKNVKLDTIQVDAAQLSGKVEHDSIRSVFQIFNSKNEEKYTLSGIIKSRKELYRLHLLPGNVLLNYSNWDTPADNYLEISEKGLTAHNFNIHYGQEKLALTTESRDSTVSVEFNQFQLSNLTRLARGVMPANGTMDGNLKFSSSNQGVFNSSLKINNLEILERPFGSMTLELSHAQSQYTINLQIRDSVTHASIVGKYSSAQSEPDIDFLVKLDPLNLRAVEPLLFGQLTKVTGIAAGNLRVAGKLQAPTIRGDMTFKETSFRSTYLNSNFSLENEKISFNETGIILNNFAVQDTKKNKAIINGDILTTTYKDFRLDLNVSAKNFLVLNTTAEDNELYYGKVRINTTAKITGNANRPRIDMNMRLREGSDFTYVVPQKQKTVAEQEGIVQFIDRDAADDPFLKNLNAADTVRSSFSGVNLSATLELTDKETLNIIIDPTSGDKLSVKGNASLTYSSSASGNMNLSGRYEVSEGHYELSFYKFIKRKFDIEKGGTITWAGNPLLATLDLRSSYKVDASPFELISNQLATADRSQSNSYRQRLPFLVYLDLDGAMLSPQVSFQLGMPVDKRGAFGGSIYAKLNDINSRESDVNKQVFGLLILKRFVSDNPFESQGGGLESTTRTSASRLLSDQLNKLSENVKGVELSFDIKSQEDYSGGANGGDTKVQLGVSKSLFHDRLVVKLSGNVDVEGESDQQENVTDYIGDIALEYKLTNDGRFRITGFRTGNYDMIDGELTETGVGLIYIKDYNTLRELFKGNAKEK